jgi:hypothetical protein
MMVLRRARGKTRPARATRWSLMVSAKRAFVPTAAMSRDIPSLTPVKGGYAFGDMAVRGPARLVPGTAKASR